MYKIDKKHMNEMIIASSFVSIITLNVNVKLFIKKHKVANGFLKSLILHCL